MDALKAELGKLGMKCGGSLQERAARYPPQTLSPSLLLLLLLRTLTLSVRHCRPVSNNSTARAETARVTSVSTGTVTPRYRHRDESKRDHEEKSGA